MPNLTAAPSPSRSFWTYHVVMAVMDGKEHVGSAIEMGAYPALPWAHAVAVESMGKRAADVLTSDPVRGESLCDFADDAVVVGFTIQRYDGEDTDGDWDLNGGLSPAARALADAAAADTAA